MPPHTKFFVFGGGDFYAFKSDAFMRIKGEIIQIIKKSELENMWLPREISDLNKNIVVLAIEDKGVPKNLFSRILYNLKNRNKTQTYDYLCDVLPDKKKGEYVETEVKPLCKFSGFYVEGTLNDLPKNMILDCRGHNTIL